ncbi:MAG: flap endonuclease-1 [Methanomassiliicoccales archaeon]
MDISSILEARTIELQNLAGKRVAIDAYNTIYQFLSAIRQPDGKPLSTSDGRPTSHLVGLLHRNSRLLGAGIFPVYVFDGVPHPLKMRTLEKRKAIKLQAEEKYRNALGEGNIEAARSYAMQTSRITDTIVSESLKLLDLMGIPCINAPGEGEAQASCLAATGNVWCVGSQDFDSLLFGAPRLVRNLTMSGRRKLPGRREWKEIEIRLYELAPNLTRLGISREQLVDVALLIGTDFNEGINGIGPKKGLAAIRKAGRIEKTPFFSQLGTETVESVRQIFLRPDCLDSFPLEWHQPRRDEILDYLCGNFEFSADSVNSALQEIGENTFAQMTLDKWKQWE